MARAQRVRTNAGWHGRIVGDNGEPVWTTEVYTAPSHVHDALLILGEARGLDDVDERGDAPRIEDIGTGPDEYGGDDGTDADT